MTYDELLKKALYVREKFDQLNEKNKQPTWNGENLMAGFVGDVGDLSKIIMAKSGHRSMDNVDEKLNHELADCLWSILTIADYYDIDLESEFADSMNKLEARVDATLAA